MNGNPPDVTILVPVRASLNHVKTCIGSIRRTVAPHEARILVWDSADSLADGTRLWLEEAAKEQNTVALEVLGQPGNYTHGQALDELAKRLSTPFAVICDSDIEYLAPGWLPLLINPLREGKIFIADASSGGTVSGEINAGLLPRLSPILCSARREALQAVGMTARWFSLRGQATSPAFAELGACNKAGELELHGDVGGWWFLRLMRGILEGRVLIHLPAALRPLYRHNAHGTIGRMRPEVLNDTTKWRAMPNV